MVKPDVKVNYYAALELSSDASVDDCKKAYRKLALKWHPDRNPGKEEEVAPRFQAIAAANEVLSDPASKTKYDTDRKRAGIGGAATARPSAAGQRGNPWASTTSNFAPPPRRTADPTGWAQANSRPGSAANTGADRFANFPRPGPTARDSEGTKASRASAWDAARPQRQNTGASGVQQPHAGNSQQRRPPPVPPREAAAATGRPPNLPRRDERPDQSAYQHFNPPQPTAQRPNVQRSSTSSAQTPRRTGFNPNAPGSDERPTSGPSNYNTSHFRNAEPAVHSPLSPTTLHPPRQNGFGRSSRPPSIDTRAPSHHHQGPVAGQTGDAAPPHPSTAQMKRSQSVRDTTQLHQQPPRSPHTAHHYRHRSASPTKYGTGNGRQRQQGFVVGADSDSTSEESISPQSTDAEARNARPPFNQRSTRPLKKPTPPSSRMNGAPYARPPDSGVPSGYQSRRGSQHGPSRKNSGANPAGQPANNMYDDEFPSDENASPAPHSPSWDEDPQDWSSFYPFGSEKPAPASRRPSVPKWAIPSSVQVATAGKQDADSNAFQPGVWESVEEPILVDLDDGGVRIGSLPGPAANHGKDMEELLELSSGFGQYTGLDPGAQSKSRSAENIDTTFSPGGDVPITFQGMPPGSKHTSPATSRRGSPPRRGRPTLSARTSRSHINQRLSTDQSRSTNPTPLSPTSHPGVRFFGEVPSTQSSAAEPNNHFKPDQWHGHTWDFVQSPMSGAPPVRRSHSGETRGPTVPQPAHVADASDVADEQSGSQPEQSSASADAMDIDPAPPAQSTDKPPRQYSQRPSTWHQSQAATHTANHGRRRSSIRSGHESAHASGSEMPLPSLNPLGASLNGNTSAYDMSNLHNTVPFPSKPSGMFGEVASSTAIPPLPRVPDAPQQPQQLTKSSWNDFTARIFSYLNAMNKLQRTIAAKQNEFIEAEALLIQGGPQRLLASGESSTGEVGVEAYTMRCKEQEVWAEFASTVVGKHKATMEEYVRLKGRVKDMAERGQLKDA